MNLDIRITKEQFDSNSNLVITLLNSTGILVVEKYIEKDSLISMNVEYDKLLNSDLSEITHIPYSNGKAVHFPITDLILSNFPAISCVFKSDYFSLITKNYFRKDIKSNVVVYAVNDVIGTRHIANDLHFDVKRSLKFFIYLNNTSIENGAFYCVPGSHKNSLKTRQKNSGKITYANRSITRDLNYDPSELIPIEGPPGTLIVFDTDVFHKAGIVQTGERRVLRGQSEFVVSENPKNNFFHRLRNLFS